MLRSLSICLALVVGSVLFAADSLIAQSDPTAIVKERKDLMKSMGKPAMLFSRTNTLLSFPMLFCMVAAQNGGFA